MDTAFASASLLLKVVIPSENTTKTIRIETKTKVGELQEKIKKKMPTSCQPYELDSFGLFWYSDSGPLWLSEGSTLKSYNMKNGDTLEYKKRPPKISRGGTVQPTAAYLSSQGGETSPHTQGKTEKILPSATTRQTIAAIQSSTTLKGGSALWVPVRPGSAHGIPPLNPEKAPPSNSTNSSPQMSPALGISDLDSLIDDFVNGSPRCGASDPDLMSSSAINEHELQADMDLHGSGENDDNGSLSFNSMTKTYSDGQLSHTYEQSVSVEDAHTNVRGSAGSHAAPPSASMDIFNRAQQQQITETKVNMKVVETILSDALGGIEAGEVDMELVKMYISSAITIIRSMS